jgi:hypothetical protein
MAGEGGGKNAEFLFTRHDHALEHRPTPDVGQVGAGFVMGGTIQYFIA